MDAPYVVPDASASRPSNCTWRAPLPAAAAAAAASGPQPPSRSTSLSRAPLQVALLMAAMPQFSPFTCFTAFISERRLPAHCSVAVTVCLGKRLLRSASERLRGRGRPSTRSRYDAGSTRGTGRWFRLKKMAEGVM